MNITIVGRNPANAYSGGRYYAWILAEAIAQNHNLIYFSNSRPMFADDFKGYNEIDLRIVDDKFSDLECEESVDVVLFIPGMDNDNTFYKNTVRFAHQKKAHLVLINFESPNWFNKYSVIQRDVELWDNWLMISKFSSCLLSISKEGDLYAKDFYTNMPKETFFDYCYPAINTKVADKVHFDNSINKEKRILMTARFSLSDHKGSNNIPQLFFEEMRGYTLVLILGAGDVPKNIKKEIEENAKIFGVSVEYKYTLTDYQKFVEIKKAKLMLFPSFFEGYGYPPIEAQYLNTACVAFRIPVLEETSPNIDFATLGDWDEFKYLVANALEREDREYRQDIIDLASFDLMATRIDKIVSQLENKPIPQELSDISFIRSSINKPVHKIERRSLNKIVENVLGKQSYSAIRKDYYSYKNGTISIFTLILKLFSNAIVKKLVSDNTHDKLIKIYQIIKG